MSHADDSDDDPYGGLPPGGKPGKGSRGICSRDFTDLEEKVSPMKTTSNSITPSSPSSDASSGKLVRATMKLGPRSNVLPERSGGPSQETALSKSSKMIPTPASRPLLDEAWLEETKDNIKAGRRLCAECRKEFETSRIDRHFCSRECQNTYGNLQAKRGAAMMRAAYHWRKMSKGTETERKDASAYLSKMGRMLDQWIKEDVECGRRPPRRPQE